MNHVIQAIRQTTPARVLVGRAGAAYRTDTQLELRADHAAARDAVWSEVDPARDLPGLFSVTTCASSKQEYLLRPDLGRQLSVDAEKQITARCSRGCDLQIIVGDGLSAAAIKTQVPTLLPLLLQQAQHLGWTTGEPFFIRHCRVGVLNEIGKLLDPAVVILLIGERPGLATAESLSAYMAYRPRPGDTDANRNLISNIHRRGVPVETAAPRILALAATLMAAKQSGFMVKEQRIDHILSEKP